MRFQSPSLSELHAFLAVCQLGSFRQAADVLCVTQAAVSRAVLRLEQRLQCTLLDRSGPRVLPTARGREFQELVEAHVAGLENAIGRFGVRAVTRKLRLSVLPTLGTRWLVPRLGRFKEQHPRIEVELRQFHHDENFARDDVDVWIDLKRPSRPWPRGVRAAYLFGVEIAPACTPALAQGLRRPADLLALPLLHHTNYPGNWALWLRAAGYKGQEPVLGPGFDVGSNLIVAACAGMGTTIIQPWLIEAELAAGQLVLPFRQSVATDRGYYLCVRAAMAGNPAVEALTRWLLDEAGASAKRFAMGPVATR
jgi:DNA-binding transcriptional LysR family regulator